MQTAGRTLNKVRNGQRKMTRLNNLPFEILCMITRFIPPEELLAKRANLLLICKAWYKAAAQTVYEYVELGLLTLERFPPPYLCTKRLISKHLRSLSICLNGLDRGDGPNRINPSSRPAYGKFLNESEAQLHEALERLPSILPVCHALDNFALRAYTHIDPIDRSGFHKLYVHGSAMTNLISALPLHSLTTFVFDCPASFWSSVSDLEQSFDLCKVWAPLLPRLKHFSVRTRSVCPSLFKQLLTPNTAVCKQLETIVINTALSEYDEATSKTRGLWSDLPRDKQKEHAYKCKNFHISAADLCAELVAAAREALPILPAIRRLQIFRQDAGCDSLIAMDCLTLKVVQMPWGDWTNPTTNTSILEVDKVHLFGQQKDEQPSS